MSGADMPTTRTQAVVVATAPRQYALALIAPYPRLYLIDRPLLVGRAADCDVELVGDTAASRAHARLVPGPQGVELIDMDSRNGVYLDGVRIATRTVVTSGVLRLGDSIAVLVPESTEADAEVTGPLVGGAALARHRRIAGLVGPTDLAVLITGETGTGKEVLACWLHELSRRAGAFVAVNCAALPESLVEAELFGHARGAFTGAVQARRGLIAEAAGGTLFLDEVGDLPLAAQAKMLRVLEDRTVRAVGGTAAESVDFRLIAATNVDLTAAVERGAFRSDLLARLAAVELHLPPLRDHIEDLAGLCACMLQRAGLQATLMPDAWEMLARYSWPQNVRELAQVLRAAATIATGPIELVHLPERIQAGFRRTANTPAVSSETRELSRNLLDELLRRHAGNLRRVSQEIGIARTRLYRLLKQWSLDPAEYRSGMHAAPPRNQS
jgi:DNA-binding NtrC family response regulator